MLNVLKAVSKLVTLSLILLISSSAYAATEVKSVETCGLDSDGKVLIASTICPQNNSMYQLFQLFPDLTLRAINSIGLDYGPEMISRFVGTDGVITREERKLQIVSYHIYQLSKRIVQFMIIWCFFAIIQDLMLGDKDRGAHGRMKRYETGVGVFIGTLLMLQVAGFYGFQWLVVFAAIAGIGLSQFVITSIAWMFQANTSPQYLSDDIDYTYDATDEATLMTSKEVDMSVCIAQLAANSMLLKAKQTFWGYDTPPLFTKIDFSLDGDAYTTPIEIYDESDDLIIAYGAGVSSSEITEDDLNPTLCGKEKVHQDQSLSSVVDEVAVDYSNAVEVFQKYAAKQLGKEELTTDTDIEVGIVDALRARFFRELMSRYRNPSISDDRAQAFLMSMKIAEKIRKYNCLAGNPREKFRRAKSSLKLMTDGNGLGSSSLACLTNITIELYGLTIDDSPHMYFDDSVLETAEETQKAIEAEIVADIQELNEFHKEMIEPIYTAFFEAGQYKSSDTQDGLILKMIQQGLMNGSANYIKLAMYTDSRVVGSTLVNELRPDIQALPLNSYYLPVRNELPADEVHVSTIKSIPNSYNPSVKSAYSAVGFENDLYQVMNSKSPLNTSSSITSRIGEKIISMISGALESVQASSGFGYRMESIKNSDFLIEAVNNNWTNLMIREQFLLRCMTSNLDSFNLEMSKDCLSQQRAAPALMKDMGTQVFQAGATLFESFLMAKLTLGVFQKTSGNFGSIGTSTNAYLQSANGYVSKIGKIFGSVEGTAFMTAIMMMILGAIFALILPYIPVFYLLILNSEYTIFIAIGGVAGCVLVPMLFKPRFNDGHRDVGEDGFLRMCIYIIMRPLALFTALVLSYVMTAISLKAAIYMFAGFDLQMLNFASGINLVFVGLIMLGLTMIAYYKIIINSYSKIHEIANKITGILQSSGFEVSKSFADKGVAFVGTSIFGVDKAAQRAAFEAKRVEVRARNIARKAMGVSNKRSVPYPRQGGRNSTKDSISNGNSIRLKQPTDDSAPMNPEGKPPEGQQ